MKRVFMVFFILFSPSCFGQEVKEVCFKDACVHAEIADTPAQRQKGLMYKKALLESQGMLFIFKEEARHGFWMKNVNFPLDIIWMDGDRKVVDIKPDLQPCQETEICSSFFPADKALYVLEVNSGFSDKHKIKIGDIMSIEGY